MLPNTRPAEGDRGDRLNESLRWYVTDESIFLSGHVDQFLPHDGYDSRNKALEAAAGYDQPMYVWSEHPLIGRVAIAVAYRSEIYLKQSDRPSDSPTNALRSAMPWVLNDNGETAMEPGLTKREHFTLELAKSMVNAVYPISHNGPNQFIDMRWPLIRDGAIRMSADLLAALGGETFEGDPPIELKSGQPDT